MVFVKRTLSVLLLFILGFVFFQKPQFVTDTVPCEPQWQYEMPVAWLEKRDEELEYWLQNQKKK